MSREEAISLLTQVNKILVNSNSWLENTHEPLNMAFDMAIKALEQESILDKIRAEIEQLKLHKAEFLTNDNKVCIDSQEVLNVIDKYKTESEEV